MDIGQTISAIISAPLSCISWLIAGAIAGALAHNIMKAGNATLSVDIVLGLLGALVGGFIVNLLNIDRPVGGVTGFLTSIIVALVGAIILIAIGRLIRGRAIVS